MKRKITRIKAASTLNQKLLGLYVFRITGPCVVTGRKVTLEFTGTREQAENAPLQLEEQG